MKRKRIILSLVIGCFVAFTSCSPYPRESQRMAAAFEQAQLVYGEGENDTLLFIPELDKASAYYARKKDYGKAALAALYHGYAEKDYDKTLAMNAFKEAERYGEFVNDSLTVARAQYQMGRMLYYDGMKDEALSVTIKSDAYFGNHYKERSLAMNALACSYIHLNQYAKADSCLKLSLHYANLGKSEKTKQKALNNYAILYEMQGEYDMAIKCLRMVKPMDNQQMVLNQLNLGNAFMALNDMDSAAFYYHLVEENLSNDGVRDETKAAAYLSFSRWAERQYDFEKSLEFNKKHLWYIGKVRDRREEKNIYRIQQKYDNEVLQRKLDGMTIQKKQITMALSLIMVAILGFFLVLYYRYVQKRIQEVKLNNVLVQFMEQNEELLKQSVELKNENHTMVGQLLDLQNEKLKTMQKLDLFLKDRKNATALTDLEKQLFSGKDHWEVMLEVIDNAYPGLFAQIKDDYPSMDDLERKVCLLSRFKLSRYDEAAILGVGISVLDKVRGRVKKFMEQSKIEQ